MSTRREISWSLGCQIAAFIVAFGGSMIVARLLAPWEMGLSVIAQATLGIVQVLATFGISTYLIRDDSLDPDSIDLAFSVNALVLAGVSVTLILLSFASEPLLGDARAGQVLRLLSINPLLNIFAFRPSTLIQRELRFHHYGVITASGTIVISVTTALLAWAGWSFTSAAWGTIAGTAVTTVLFIVVAPHHVSFRLNFRGWRKIARFGLEIMSISGVAIVASRLSEIVLARVLGIAALGIYSRASVLSNIIFENIYGAITRVIFARLSQDMRENGSINRQFLLAFDSLVAIMWPVQLGLAILAPPVIVFTFGRSWLDAAMPLTLLMIAQAIVLSFGMNWELFVLRRETARQARLEIWRASIGFAAFTIGCQFGIAGAAAGRIAEASVGHYLYSRHIDRLADIAPGTTARILRRNFALTAIGVAPAGVLMWLFDWSPDVPLTFILAAIALGAMLWLAALTAQRHPLINELNRLRLSCWRGTSA